MAHRPSDRRLRVARTRETLLQQIREFRIHSFPGDVSSADRRCSLCYLRTSDEIPHRLHHNRMDLPPNNSRPNVRPLETPPPLRRQIAPHSHEPNAPLRPHLTPRRPLHPVVSRLRPQRIIIHLSEFTIHNSPFTINLYPFAFILSPFEPRPPLTGWFSLPHEDTFTIHHSPFTIHHSQFTTHH